MIKKIPKTILTALFLKPSIPPTLRHIEANRYHLSWDTICIDFYMKLYLLF